MTATPTLYSTGPTPAGEAPSLSKVWEQDGDGPFPSGTAQARQLSTSTGSYLVCAGPSGDATAVSLSGEAPYFASASSDLKIGGPWDALESFVLGNAPYLLGYEASSGEISIYPVDDQLAASTPYVFFRKRPPAISTGFDMITPVVVLGSVYLLGYIKKTGDVRAYSLSVTATNPPSAPGTPPLLATPVWDHQWAPGWTRFAFFTLGGEVFFFKINDGKLNVNIDHLNDNPALGTVEVGSYLQDQLPDALQIDLARAFTLDGGDPHLLMYKTDGSTDLYRVRGDCQGWVKQSSTTTVSGAVDVVPISIGDQSFVLFY